MAYVQKNIGASTVSHYVDDIKVDFPATGIKTTPRGLVSILLGPNAGQAITVSVTYDSPDMIDNSTAVYVTIQTVASGGGGTKIDLPIGPTGVLLTTTGSGFKAWIIG